MESLGDFLKETRIKRDISIAQIEKATHISSKFLQALENEEFSVFPGEAYLKGFLRSYCVYLELDADEMIKRYENIKMAESDAPIEQLIPKPKPNLRPLFVILFFIIILGASVFGGIKLFNIVFKDNNTQTVENKPVDEKETTEDTKKNENGLFKILEPGQRNLNVTPENIIECMINEKSYQIKVKQIYPVVVLTAPAGNELYLIKDYPYKLDLNADDELDIEINAISWDEKLANLMVKLYNQEEKEKNKTIFTDNIKGYNPETIALVKAKQNINILLDIKENTYLRYKIDNNEEIEGFFNPENKSLSAEHRIVLWLSNAGVVDFNFKDFDRSFNPGEKGEVKVTLIEWNKNSDDEFALQVSSVK